jgi:tetratricopeptide (TPR) repeat protein
MRLILPLLLFAAPFASAQQPQSDAQKLEACLAKIPEDPDAAYEDAIAWLYNSAGDAAAQQCTALALIGLGRVEEGAARLETLANAKEGGTLEQRGVYLAQAGNAWLVAGAPEAAIVTLTNALKLRPQDSDLYIDRARAHLTMKKWKEGGKDLDQAIKLSPGAPDALTLRAKALYEDGRLADAYDDIRAALSMGAKDDMVLLLRGEIREAMRAKGMKDPEGLN